MSKAILIMDMPECCYICPLTQCEADNMSTEHRGKNCPLRKMPEKRPERILSNLGRCATTASFKESDLNIGWNACIDAIEGSGANG